MSERALGNHEVSCYEVGIGNLRAAYIQHDNILYRALIALPSLRLFVFLPLDETSCLGIDNKLLLGKDIVVLPTHQCCLNGTDDLTFASIWSVWVFFDVVHQCSTPIRSLINTTVSWKGFVKDFKKVFAY